MKNKNKYNFCENEVVALIPARGGSKGVPRKNIRNLNGYPLISYTIAACQISAKISRIIVSTDDKEIADISKRFGAEVPFIRPAELASDVSGDIEFVMHAIEWLQENEKKVPEYLVHMRPTTPLRDPALIDEAIDRIKMTKNSTSLRSAHPAPESPLKWFVEGDDNTFIPFVNGITNDEANNGRAGFEKVYIPDGYVDILKPECIVNTGLLHGQKMLSYISPFCTEVDTEYEFGMLEYEVMKKGSEIYDYLEKNYSRYREGD